MPTVAEKRAWLREHTDLEVPDRGRLGPDLEQAWADGNATYDGVVDADFGDGLEPAEREPETPLEPERAPGTPRARRRAQSPQQRVRGLFGGGKAKDKPAPKGKAKKIVRVPVEHLISRVWEGAARIVQPLSLPVSRCLQVQSPVAGMILEDVVRDTVVDRALQPIARAEEKTEKVLALVAPPILVASLEQTAALEAAGAITAQQAMMRRAFQVPLLRESLRIWLQVAGPKVEEAARREEEYQRTFGKTIDELMALFFGPVTMTAEQAAPEPEPAMAS